MTSDKQPWLGQGAEPPSLAKVTATDGNVARPDRLAKDMNEINLQSITNQSSHATMVMPRRDGDVLVHFPYQDPAGFGRGPEGGTTLIEAHFLLRGRNVMPSTGCMVRHSSVPGVACAMLHPVWLTLAVVFERAAILRVTLVIL